MPILFSVMAVISGYLLGSIPSAYLVGWLKGRRFTKDDDGRLGTSLAFHQLGMFSGIIVGLLDFSKGVMAIVLAYLLDVPLPAILLAGLAAVAGHNWSILQDFRGGRGIMTSYGVLAALILWEFLIAIAMAGIILYFTHRPTFATAILLSILPVILWLQSFLRILPELPWQREITSLLVVFPLSLFIPISLKFLQMKGDKPPL